MRKIRLLALFFGLALLCGAPASAQDTLPRFNVHNAGNNRIIIGWINPYPNITQISIQRAFDSLGPYKSIASLADPRSVQNGYTDRNAPNDHMFYRIFYALEGGSYFFTKAKKPDTASRQAIVLNGSTPRPVIGARDVPNKYKDSVFVRNRDTLVIVNHDTLRVTTKDTISVVKKPPVVKKPEWVPSTKVFTNNEGYVTIRLQDAEEKKYTVKFFDGEEFLFELRGIKEKLLLLDKANFYHSGWFNFELYNDDKLVERNKFFLKP
ncbi:hypothetical protein EPD60_04360 [Flaviaesturariibacter flavus]|uniref:S9 family peptidase n=1 Tax=Flaviaesturariibacter flavus TaxID=2502780 RepID=A0A4R1BJD3_9BACT|nr:hypothetical protein [Flaviaesturariibacter flavus]TCJ17430.1 hypothetical protein EPD60_04360 [Flaviaesturariibacter flavus]